jgi:hypothetical protein
MNQKPEEQELELKRLQERIEAHRKRLQKLHVRVALQGIDAKPEDSIEIEEIESQISELEGGKWRLREAITCLSKDEIIRDTAEIGGSLDDLGRRMEGLDERTSMRGVGFTNRRHELDHQILGPFSKPFIVIDAPASYGKTYLLRAVEQRLGAVKKEKWICRRVDCHRFGNNKMGIMMEITGGIVVGDVNELLPLIDGTMDSAQANGLILLFDSIEHLDDEISSWLKASLIPAINRALKTNRKFRALFAGRYVGPWGDGFNLPHFTLSLTPFSRQVVQEFVQGVGERLGVCYPSEELEAFAEELLDITGGYPKAIVDIAEYLGNEQKFIIILDKMIPDYYFQLGRKIDLYNRFVLREIPGILQGVDLILQKAFETVSVFRVFNADTLDALIETGFIQGWGKGWELFKAMQATRLIGSRPGYPLVYDRILQRVLAAKMRFENPSRYEEFQRFAVTLYDRWIQGLKYPDGKLPDQPTGSDQIAFIVEGLYHYLCTAQDKEEILGKLDKYLNWLRHPFGPRRGAEALKSAIEEDEQLPRMLRRATGDEGYQKLRKRIDRFGEEGEG